MRRMFSKPQIEAMIKAGASQEIIDALQDDGVIGTALSGKADLEGNNEFTGNQSITGDVSATGDLSVTGDISGDDITGNSIIENMSGYSYDGSTKNNDFTPLYVGVVKNGNKLSCVFFMSFTPSVADYSGAPMGILKLPVNLNSKLVTFTLSGIENLLDAKVVPFYSGYNVKKNIDLILQKYVGEKVLLQPAIYGTGFNVGTTYLFRYEVTFLLSDNLIPQE